MTLSHTNFDPPFELPPASNAPGTLREMWLHGALCRYWEYGQPQGPTFVAVHGFRGDHHGLEIIAHWMLQSRPDARILIPDLPGFGRSQPLPQATHDVATYAQWLSDFLATISTGQRVYLIGHSFGSIVATATAAFDARCIQRLCLINPISEPALEGDQRLMSRAAALYYRLGALLPEKLGFALLRSRLVTRLSSEFMMKNKLPALRRYINGQHDAYFGAFVDRQVVLEAYQASISSTVGDYATCIDAPVQMIVASQDDLGSLDAQRRLYSLFAHARLDIIDRVGHLIHYETPQAAAQLILDFQGEDHEALR